MKTAYRAIQHLLGLVYPNLCFSCLKNLTIGQAPICLVCQHQLTTTDQYQYKENAFTERFWGRIDLHTGSSYYKYSKSGKVRKLIHELKYNNKPQIGRYIGEQFGKQLAKAPLYKDLEVIIPVPLHPKKQHQRGYNQSYLFATGLSEAMQLPIDQGSLKRKVYTDSQTTKSRLERFTNVSSAFYLEKRRNLVNKNVLLVDDVMTTGATLEACGQLLLQEGKIESLYMATIAFAND